MDKVLLTLVAFSSGVTNLMKIMNSSEGPQRADSRIVNLVDRMSDSHAVQEMVFMSGQPTSTHKEKGCESHVQKSGYVIIPGVAAYSLHMHSVNWNNALKSCMVEGAQLAIIKSQEEAKMLAKWMNRENVKKIWIGTHDLFKTGEWMTLRTETLEAAGYDHWLPGRPNNEQGWQHCGAFTSEGAMTNIDCSLEMPYFCKIEIC